MLAQFRLQTSWLDGTFSDIGFQTRMLRPLIRGHIYRPWISYFFQTELATATPQLLDMQIDIHPWEAFGVRFGQFLTPYSREFLVPLPLIQFPDFGLADDYFRTHRDTGVMVYGMPASAHFEYYLGVFNGNGLNKKGPNDNTGVMPMLRLVAAPLGKVTYHDTPSLDGPVPLRIAIAIDAFINTTTPTTMVVDAATQTLVAKSGVDVSTRNVGGDFTLYWDRFVFIAEGFFREREPDDTHVKTQQWGSYVQTGYFVMPKRLEVAARAGWLDPDTGAKNDFVQSYEGLLNTYVYKNRVKFNLRYQFTRADADAPAPLQVKKGDSHAVTLQAQIWL